MATDLEHVRSIAQRVAESSGLELVDVELRGGGKHRMLRLVIDRAPGSGTGGVVGAVQGVGVSLLQGGDVQGTHLGVTHEDCAAMSREVSAILDVEDAVPGGSYTLEVSSPGLDRKLVRPADYERFTGSRVKLMTREPIEGNRYFEGRLESFSKGRLVLDLSQKSKGKRQKRQGAGGRRQEAGGSFSHPVAPKAGAQGWGTRAGAGEAAAEGGRAPGQRPGATQAEANRIEIELTNVERANLAPDF